MLSAPVPDHIAANRHLFLPLLGLGLGRSAAKLLTKDVATGRPLRAAFSLEVMRSAEVGDLVRRHVSDYRDVGQRTSSDG
jgi:hypothetical protein